MNKLSKKGATFVRLHEGFIARWYLDPVGIPTIGIGFTWRSDSFRKWWKKNKPGVEFKRGATMTRSEADDALQYLVNNEYGLAVNQFLGKKVDQHVYDGMVSPVYNLGPGALKWKWATAIKRGDIADGARRLTTTGTTAQGRKLPGLVRRRKEEAALIRDSVYTGVDAVEAIHGLFGGSPAPVADAMADGMLVRGEAGPAVADLITSLANLGYYDGTLDDIFGHGTQAAVVEFQRDHSLVADGIAGPATLAAIATADKKSPTPVQVGSNSKPIGVGAGLGAAITGLIVTFGCDIPFIASFFDACSK